jgi:hypothetical protein
MSKYLYFCSVVLSALPSAAGFALPHQPPSLHVLQRWNANAPCSHAASKGNECIRTHTPGLSTTKFGHGLPMLNSMHTNRASHVPMNMMHSHNPGFSCRDISWTRAGKGACFNTCTLPHSHGQNRLVADHKRSRAEGVARLMRARGALEDNASEENYPLPYGKVFLHVCMHACMYDFVCMYMEFPDLANARDLSMYI